MSNSRPIGVKQNSQPMLDLLQAMRQAYTNAKRIGQYQLALSVSAGLGVVVIHFFSSAKAWVGLWGVLAVLIDAVLEPRSKRVHETGAQIQEMFDEHVLELPRSGITRPDPEVRHELADGFQRANGDVSSLQNWYPAEVDALPLEQARLVCQRSNMQWDAKLREHVWTLYLYGLLGLLASAFVWGLARHLSLEGFVASVMVPILPGAVQFWRKLDAHHGAAKESETGKDRINRLWASVAKGELAQSELTREARQIQDGLYERRRRSPQVPELVYKLKRTAFEKQMKVAAAEMVAEARQAGMPAGQ